jgi:hypothetical protein
MMGDKIWHLVPLSVHSKLVFGYSCEFVDYVFPFCAGKEQVRIQDWNLWWIVESKYANLRFLGMLVRHYPILLCSPLTESALREAGCDIEAEWALWQLGGG